MPFSFECPHCEMGIEAEFELCGSTCTCPGCGGLFIVPEVDPAVFGQAHTGAGGLADGSASGNPGTEVFAELARLQGELAEAAEQRQRLERQLARERAKVSKEAALPAELREAKAARKKAEALVVDLGKQLEDLQRRFDEAQKAAGAEHQAREGTGERFEKDLAAARQDLEGHKRAAEQGVRETELLRRDLEAARSEITRLSGENAAECERASREAEELSSKIAKLESERKSALEKSAGDFAELERLQGVIEAGHKEAIARGEKLELKEKEAERLALETGKLRESVEEGQAAIRVLEKERDEARTSTRWEIEALQKRVDQQKGELERSSRAVQEAVRELERLRVELAGAKAEKSVAERGFAGERQQLLDRLHVAEGERESLREASRLQARAAAEPDGEVERLRGELIQARGDLANAERLLAAGQAQIADKERSLQLALEAAETRSSCLLGELAGLRSRLEEAQKNLDLQRAQEAGTRGLSPEAEAELRQILARRDLEIQRLASQLRDATQGGGGDSSSHPLWGWLHGKAALAACVVALSGGLLGGAFLSRPRTLDASPPNSASKDAPPLAAHGTVQTPVNEPSPAKGSVPGGDQNVPPALPPAAPVGAETTQSTVSSGSAAVARSGMPAPLPDQFLGIRFGTELGEVPGISLWKETAGKRHRKAELLGSEVEAVLTADSRTRVIMGSYVRVAFRQPESLTPFLEWAVNVQDAVSALYGEPTRVHSVEGATEAVEVVRKISAGEDFYQATWERESEDGMIDMSIRVFNERSVVFRMEYRARRLYTAHMEEQAARESAKEAARESTKDAANEVASPPKVE